MIEQRSGGVHYLQFASFQQFPELIHGVFMRHGGFSLPPYKSLNTSGSLRGGDNLDGVIRNRQLTMQSLALEGYPCMTLWSIHGAAVAVTDMRESWRTDWAQRSYYDVAWTPQEIRKGDALLAQQKGVALAFSFADCAPIALYDPVEQVIGIAHGGWRGTARGVVLATVEAMCENFHCQPRNIYAGIGPTIGACCYEVSQEVRDYFTGRRTFEVHPTLECYHGFVRESAAFSVVALPDRDSLRLDLWETNRRQLLMAGLLPEHIEVSAICTSDHVKDFYSYRAEQGKTGRFPMLMALRAS